MKKIIFACSFFLALKTAAQPVLTNTSQIGYVAPVAVASAATVPLVPIATTGANVTWDCSGLLKEAAVPIINYTVSAPAGTLYAADYPGANWHFTDPAFVAIIGHTYYNLSIDSFVLWGRHVTGNAYEIYDNPEMDLKFPFGYSQSVNNTYSKTNYNAAGGISSYQTGDVTLTYDGYGTLILPNGTYTDVVRVKKVRTNNLGPTLNSYFWYNSTNGERLLFYEEKDGAGPNVVFNTNVVNSVSVINNDNKITIGNNVDDHKVVISSSKNIDKIFVYNITGQLVYSMKNINTNKLDFSLESAKGLYIISIETDGHTVNDKVLF